MEPHPDELRAECALRDHPTLGRWLTQQANGRLKVNTSKVKTEARLDGKYLIAGDDALAACKVACTACGKCVMDAAPGLISIASGVAVVDYALNELADEHVIDRCPTGAIVWLTGAQFTPDTRPADRQGPPRGARIAPPLIGSAT